jgi:predicted PurR-regulated permease PerM
VRTVDLDWRSVANGLAITVAMLAAFAIVRSIPHTVTWFVIGSLLALALNPLVGSVQRRLDCRRAVGVAVVLMGFIAAVVTLSLVLGPPAARQVRSFQKDLPGVVNQIGDLPLIGNNLERNDVPQKVQDWVEHLPTRLAGNTRPLEHAARSVLSGLLAGLATMFITVALLLDGERLIRAGRRAVPRRHRARADRIGDLFYRIVGQYFAGSLLVAAVAGVFVLVVGLALGVPLTPLVALWVAVFDLVPQIGGAAGGIVFVALGFTQGATTGAICAALFVLYLQFENHVLQPLIVGEAVDLSAPATMVAALVGVSAAGVPGALVAVPCAGAAKAVYLELRPPEGYRRNPRRQPWERFGRLSVRLFQRQR